MVIPNFFITFVRHSFHTSHSLHIPSRERRHRPAHTPATRRHTSLMAHALPHALRTRDSLTRCTSQGLCHTRYAHTTHPRPCKAMPHTPRTRYASSPSQHPRPPRYHPRKGLRHAALPPSMKATLLHAPAPRKFSAKKARAP